MFFVEIQFNPKHSSSNLIFLVCHQIKKTKVSNELSPEYIKELMKMQQVLQ